MKLDGYNGRCAAVVVLASLTLLATVAGAGIAAARYPDPRGDYTRPPIRSVSPDVIALRVSNTARSVTFDIDFVRAPRRLWFLDVLLETDVHRALGLGKGRYRKADLNVSGEVVGVYGTGKRRPAYAFLYVGAPLAQGAVGSIRADAKSVHLTFPTRFVVRDQRQRKHPVVIPGRFRFFIRAWGDPAMNLDREFPDEDVAPNSGWFTYRMT